MSKLSKKQKASQAKVDANKLYLIEEAMAVVKDANYAKFDASVDLHIKLGVDPRKADQAIRGTVSLPHGTGKSKTVAVFCTPEKEDEARAAGAGDSASTGAGLAKSLFKTGTDWTGSSEDKSRLIEPIS